MARLMIGVGLFLSLLGITTYFGTGMVSVTALIPTFFGVPLIILGWIARRGGGTTVVYLAAAVGLLGFLGAGSRLLTGNEEASIVATVSVLLMTLVLGAFVGLCIKFLLDERNRGTAGM